MSYAIHMCLDLSLSLSLDPSLSPSIIVAPEIVHSPPGLIQAEKGDTMRLPCVARGEPRPLVAWYSDGEPVIGQLEDGSLLLSKVTNSKLYECRASNIAGKVKNNVYLLVS